MMRSSRVYHIVCFTGCLWLGLHRLVRAGWCLGRLTSSMLHLIRLRKDLIERFEDLIVNELFVNLLATLRGRCPDHSRQLARLISLMVRSRWLHHTVLSMWLHDPLLRVMLIGANHLLSNHLTRMLVQDQISRRFGRLLQQCALAKVMLLVVG